MTAIFIRKEAPDRYQCVTVNSNDKSKMHNLILAGRKRVANIVTVFDSYTKVAPIVNDATVTYLICTAKKVYM